MLKVKVNFKLDSYTTCLMFFNPRFIVGFTWELIIALQQGGPAWYL